VVREGEKEAYENDQLDDESGGPADVCLTYANAVNVLMK